ncbi:MAG TPA: Cof-type HAD-IIB family hydrolase [Capsulimonadaceae bacterium]|nr:Cof-type HAD-IIB family hydrolase [Capsulimonadaceae bacterium]
MTPQLIALDLDGTLLTQDKRISPRNLETVQALAKQGVSIVLASGRMHQVTAIYASELGLPDDAPVISYNGAMGRTHAGEPIFEWPVPNAEAAEIVQFCWENDYHLNFYHADMLYVSHATKWAELYYSRTGSLPHPIGDLRSMEGKEPTKLIIINEPRIVDELFVEMSDYYGDRLYLTRTDDEYLELLNPDANKGQALEEIAKRLGVPQERCLAMGDNYNDIPMLQWAGVGVAMSNSRKELFDYTSERAPDADEDGVAVYLSRFLA